MMGRTEPDGYDGDIMFGFEYYDDDEDWDAWDIDPCDQCGPWCEHWGGDGLCMLVIEQMAEEEKFFEKKYMSTNKCPVCDVELTQYQIPTDQLWTWPGVWLEDGEYYNPMIALGIFGAYGGAKGEVHPAFESKGFMYHHIWVGIGEGRTEKMIMLNKA